MGLRGHEVEVVQTRLSYRMPPHCFVAVQDGGDARLVRHALRSDGAVFFPAVDEDGLPWSHKKAPPSNTKETVAGKEQMEFAVIMEADEKSGAMITARYAEELGRELWAVPGRICDENSAGTNRLLNRGARCLCDVREFAENFTGRREQLELFSEEETEPEQEVVQEQGAVQEKKAVNAEPELSDDEKVIYALIQKKGHRLLDELIAESGKEIGDVVSAIVMLQAEGLVVEAGGRYSATN